ncbi:hypothetical protein [Streptomyces europaeiscabiei]|uniref:hypothetical protein n=1 Tax=Streptomyces europaeiscabiei TaxID=146819 RepID=UPI0038F6445E
MGLGGLVVYWRGVPFQGVEAGDLPKTRECPECEWAADLREDGSYQCPETDCGWSSVVGDVA